MAIGYVIPISAEFRKAYRRKSKKGRSFWVRGGKSLAIGGGVAALGAGAGVLAGGGLARKIMKVSIDKDDQERTLLRKKFGISPTEDSSFKPASEAERKAAYDFAEKRGRILFGGLGAVTAGGAYAIKKAVSAAKKRKAQSKRG